MSKKKKKSKKKPIGVLVEMRVQPGATGMFAMRTAGEMKAGGFKLDQGYAPVKMGGPRARSGSMSGREAQTYLVRGEIEEDKISELEKDPNVVKVWIDTKIAPFSSPGKALVSPMSPTGTCPIPPCDCSPGTPKGTIADVVNYLGVDQIWSEGYNGTAWVYEWVVAPNGEPWRVTDFWFHPLENARPVVRYKVALSYLALFNTTFARNMVVWLEDALPEPINGYPDGMDNSRRTHERTSSIANTLILDAARYALHKEA